MMISNEEPRKEKWMTFEMVELNYKFSDKFCDVNKVEELEMDTDSFYLAWEEEDLDSILLDSLYEPTEPVRWKDIFHTSSSILPTSLRNNTYHRIIFFTENWGIVTLTLKTLMIIRNSLIKKLRLKTKPHMRIENCNCLISVWKLDEITTLRNIIQCYNYKDVVATHEATQNLIDFWLDKRIGKLNLGCTLPNREEICQHRSTEYKFYPFFHVIRICLKNTGKKDRWSLSCFHKESSSKWEVYWETKQLV